MPSGQDAGRSGLLRSVGRRSTTAYLFATALAAGLAALGAGGAAGAEAARAKLPSSPGIAKLTQYTLPPEDLFPYAIASGPSAGPDQMWFTAGRGQPGRTAIEQKIEPVIGRISFGGEIREFPVPDLSLAPTPNAITAGNDGAGSPRTAR